jgi:hypothetical protein
MQSAPACCHAKSAGPGSTIIPDIFGRIGPSEMGIKKLLAHVWS